ncbi:Inositol-tetrakisphosphate 1-kinase 2 [Morus notabilis]|uniref:Inositol-tetrakisphosphate 1-kinase 2 n=1 Tax=Morus notabilis TaxID=981085 RepID=W9RWY4_9ROSA|nr:Inositol-tetrakisphosphate 1-kinase 2 [Morus notabilis]
MREEMVYSKEEDMEREEFVEERGLISEQQKCCIGVGGFPLHKRSVVVVGYALTSKKTKSFLQPKLEGLARNKGILFVAIDHNRPLSDQGPFDIVLHKLSGKEWRQVLESASLSFVMNHDSIVEVEASRLRQDYRQTHPEVTVLDPPDAIQHLRNRQYMLQAVADMDLSESYGKVGVPKQLVIKKDGSSISDAVAKSGLTLPLVAKPLVADGSAKSHELSLAFDRYSLQKLEPPLVLQEFVNHGGVLFKVYIIGEAIKVLRRFSLPDVSKRELSKTAGVYRFPRVSCAAASADDADLEPDVAELPPRPLLERLAKDLRRRLGLRLFNLDIIREHGTRDQFYVIDINYFPGKFPPEFGARKVQEKSRVDSLESLAGFGEAQVGSLNAKRRRRSTSNKCAGEVRTCLVPLHDQIRCLTTEELYASVNGRTFNFCNYLLIVYPPCKKGTIVYRLQTSCKP